MVQPDTTRGHSQPAWEAAKKEALRVLVAKAKEENPLISYGDLSRLISAISFDPHGFDFHELLGQLSRESDADCKGMISVLVVRAEDGRPGKGFFSLAEELGRDVSHADEVWIRELDKVRAAFA